MKNCCSITPNIHLLHRISGLFRESDSRPDPTEMTEKRTVPRGDNNLDFHLLLRLRDSTAFADMYETKSRKVSTARWIIVGWPE